MCPRRWAGAWRRAQLLIVSAGRSLGVRNVPECCVGRAAVGPGSWGLQSALASFDHFSQGKPIKETIPSPLCLQDTRSRPVPSRPSSVFRRCRTSRPRLDY